MTDPCPSSNFQVRHVVLTIDRPEYILISVNWMGIVVEVSSPDDVMVLLTPRLQLERKSKSRCTIDRNSPTNLKYRKHLAQFAEWYGVYM